MRKILIVMGVVALSTLISIVYFGTTTFSKAKEYAPTVEVFVDSFYAKLNRHEYESIYQTLTDQTFRQAAPYDDFAAYLYGMQEKLGAVTGREKGRWKINLHPSGTFYYVQYQVQREKASSLDTFTLKKNAESWLVQNYNVSAKELYQ